MRLPNVSFSTILRLFPLLSFLSVIALAALAEIADAYELPRFRKVEAAARLPEIPPDSPIGLLADADFPPFSFSTGGGEPAGLSVELALAACAEIKVKCQVQLKPLPDLLPALASGQGDLIVSGPRIDEQALNGALVTRPWFRSFGRFAALAGSPLLGSSPRDLTGKRIAVIKNTLHAAWLRNYYPKSEILEFASEMLAEQALRTGNVEAFFADNLRLIYWLAGSNSKSCCKLLGGPISDYQYFSRGMSFLVKDSRDDLRQAFDIALDRLQTNGTTEKIFNVYVPLNPW